MLIQQVNIKVTQQQFKTLVEELKEVHVDLTLLRGMLQMQMLELYQALVPILIGELLVTNLFKKLFIKITKKRTIKLLPSQALAIQLFLENKEPKDILNFTDINNILEQIKSQLRTYEFNQIK